MGDKESISDVRIAPDKWTLKEMIAHLVDSASNNHQRFIRLQFEKELVFPEYDPEGWKTVTAIGKYDYSRLLVLWREFNNYLLYLIEGLDAATFGNVWLKNGERLTLDHLIRDYFAHIEVHEKMFRDRAEEIRSDIATRPK